MDQPDLLEIIASYTSAKTHLLLAREYKLRDTFTHVDYVVGYQHPLLRVPNGRPFVTELIHRTEGIFVYSGYLEGKLVCTTLERDDETLLSKIQYKNGYVHNANGPACVIYKTDYVVYHCIQNGVYAEGVCVETLSERESLFVDHGVYSNIKWPIECVRAKHQPCPGCKFDVPHIRS